MPPLIEPVVLQPLIMANDLGVDGLHRTGLERRSFARIQDAIEVPTLMIQGEGDLVTLPSTTEHTSMYFTGPFERVALPGVGHFPTREAPHSVGRVLLPFLLGQAPKRAYSSAAREREPVLHTFEAE